MTYKIANYMKTDVYRGELTELGALSSLRQPSTVRTSTATDIAHLNYDPRRTDASLCVQLFL